MDETNLMFKEAFKYLKEHWNPKAGDIVYDMNGVSGIVAEYTLNMVRLSRWGPDEYYDINKVYWKPRQEDLQNIAMNYLINKELEEDFEAKGLGFDWMKKEYGFNLLCDSFGLWWTFEIKTNNYNETWLCFVMETCYDKTWNGNTWEVIE